MQTKLTLTINKTIIERAKYYAKKSNRSLSEIIESYLEKITETENSENDIDLDKIRGIISLPDEFDEKEYIKELRYQKHK